MAIERVKKITVIAHNTLEEQMVETLARLGTVHVERVTGDEMLAPKELADDEVQAVRRQAFAVVQVEFVLGFLKLHAVEKPGFLKTMIRDKYQVTAEEFAQAGRRVNLRATYSEISDFERRLISMRDRKARLEAERDELRYWTELEMPMNELAEEHVFAVLPVRIAELDFASMLADLEAEAPESEVEVVGKSPPWKSCLLLYHPAVENDVTSVLSRHRCETVTLPSLRDEPGERLEQILREIAAIENRRADLVKRVKKYADLIPSLEILREYLVNERRKVELTTSFGVTRSTVAIEGWVTEDKLEKTSDDIGTVADEVVVEVSEAGDDDAPPISLKNPEWVRPFEVLTKLFGSPNRSEYDPTLVVAVSFMIFFGFCIGDVGYGLILIPAFLLLRKYLPLGPKARDLLTVLAYGSAWAIIIGILSAGYFGIESRQLPGFLRNIAFLNGLNKTTLVMGITIGIGLIHMLVGVGIEFHDNWKAGNKADALIDQGLVFFLFVGGIGIAGGLAFAKVVPASVPMIVIAVAVAGMLALLGRGARSIAGKAVNGLYETYGTVVGFVSDAISYVRLFALGLSTVMIALVINKMAGLVGGVAPVIGILLMVIVLVVGHTFNVAINLLGAFVHPLRLEFVEFFGKFYEDGGREFKPFAVESKVVMIKDREGA